MTRTSPGTAGRSLRALLMCAASLHAFAARGTEAAGFCGGSRDDGGGGGAAGGGDLVACLKAKAIAALDRASRVDALPLAGTAVVLVRDAGRDRRREQRSGEPEPGPQRAAVDERELLSKPDAALDAILYDKAVELLRGRSLRVGLSELAGEEGRGKMKKTMGMMMTAVAMKAMMVIPLALGMLFLMAGKAMIISKIALVLSLIITLKKLVSKSGEHVIHETHTAEAAWPSAAVPGGGWGRRSSSPAAGQMLAYSNALYKP